MRFANGNHQSAAFTLRETYFIIAGVLIILVFLSYHTSRFSVIVESRRNLIACQAELKSLTYDLTAYSFDHWNVDIWDHISTTSNFTLEGWMRDLHQFHQDNQRFICPADKERNPPAADSNSAPITFGYFLLLESEQTNHPDREILIGDRNLLLRERSLSGSCGIYFEGERFTWAKSLHYREEHIPMGNIAHRDGSVSTTTNNFSPFPGRIWVP